MKSEKQTHKNNIDINNILSMYDKSDITKSF